MAYSMLNTKTFIELVRSGKYKDRSGASRALGKIQSIPEEEKPKCRRVIDEVFGASEDKAVKAKPKPKAEKAEAKTEKRRPGRPPGSKNKSKQPEKEPTVSHVAPIDTSSIIVGNQPVGSLDDVNSITVQLRIAEKTIQNAGSVMSILLEAKRLVSDVDVNEAIERIAITLTGAVNIFDNITNKVTNALIKKDEASSSANGGSGKVLFHASMPKAD